MKNTLVFLLLAVSALAQNTAIFPTAVPTTAQLGVAANRAETTLTAGITSSATSIPVTSSSAFKVGSFATIDSEQIAVCGIPDGTHLNVGVSACPNVDGRGIDTANGAGAAASHLSSAKVQARVVAWHQNQMAAEVIAADTKLRNELRSLKDFGCKGDGTTDDTACVQAAANYLPQTGSNLLHGRTVFCPPGTYKITGTITIANLYGGAIVGEGHSCDFVWFGGSGGPMFDLQNVAESVFDNFRITVDVASHLTEAVRMEATSGYAVSWRHNQFRNLWVDGNTGQLDIGFRGMIGSGGDVNGDFMLFTKVRTSHYLQTAWSIEGTQFNGWRMEDCWSDGADGSGNKLGKYAVSGGTVSSVDKPAKTNFYWHGGFVGHHTQADFYMQQPSTAALTTTIADLSSEGSNRFLIEGIGVNGNGARTILDNVRWSELGLNADHRALILYSPGPFFIRNCMFGEAVGGDGTAVPVILHWQYADGNFAPYMEITGTTFMTSLNTYNGVFDIGASGKAPTYVWGTVAQQTQSAYVALDQIRAQTPLTETLNSYMDTQGFHPSTTDGDKAIPYISGANGPLRSGDATWTNSTHLLNLHAPGGAGGFGPNLLTFDALDGTGFGLGSQPGVFQVMAHASGDEIDMGYGPSASFTSTVRFPMNGGFQLVTGGANTCDAAHRGKFVYIAGAAGVKDQVIVCGKDAADVYSYRVIY